MAKDNVIKKGVKITLDKERNMRFTFRAFEILAEKYGSVGDAIAIFSDSEKLTKLDKVALGAVVDFVHAGLRYDDNTLTREMVLDMIDMSNIKYIMEAITQALNASNPPMQEGEPGEVIA